MFKSQATQPRTHQEHADAALAQLGKLNSSDRGIAIHAALANTHATLALYELMKEQRN
jgi:hypothetical protein